TRIAEQKLSLDNLIGLMTEQKKDQDVAVILSDLIDLRDSFIKIKTSAGQTPTSTDPNTKVTSVGGGSKFDVTKDDISEIARKAEAIRTKIINKS
ncbi:MAG TPA: hypothetical protein VNZ86_12320, partial [Bacteroidia bacterium]|nr:hypothetical protein [Bacteroidia bacterium]